MYIARNDFTNRDVVWLFFSVYSVSRRDWMAYQDALSIW